MANVEGRVLRTERRISDAGNSTLSTQRSILLAIDTCTKRASIALRDETTLRAEMTWECQRQETATVSARIRDLMQSSHIEAQDVGAIAVAIGPGSFTGVRCGLAIGKGMAVARSLPMIGVTAFDVIAHAQPNHGMPMLAVLEAGRSRVAACCYEWQDGAPAVASDWWLQSWSELSEAIEPPMWVCGDLPSQLLSVVQGKATVAPAWLNLRRAGVLADLAHARWQRGEIGDAMTLTAIYPAET
jgi:tRNA threonylcarbamoyladenosine biosynthesis protein TsaB